MAAGERRVTVRGFSPGVTEDQLLLFFESGRCCPQGGDVEKINIFGETAVMTFEDADVVKKLLNADIKFEGKSLIIERCKPQTDATQIARPSVKCRAPPPPVKQKPKLQGEFVATRRTQKAPPPPVAPKRADKQADFDGTNFGRNNNCRMVAAEQPSPSSETDPVCQDNDYEQWESVEEDDDGEISVSSQPTQHVVVAAAAAAGEQLEKLSLKPPVEEERHVTERVASDKHTSQREIELPEPKLKLLQKLQLAKKIDFECELSFDFAKGIVVLPETCGNTVERIYELLVAAVCKRVNLEIDAGEFFSVAERMTWLETWLKNSCPELTAVTYLEKSILYVLTACENTSMEIAKVLESSFASETVEIEDCYLPYLNATAVVDTINNHPKECTSVRVDRTKRLITVDGLTHVVSIVMGDIKNVLKRNSKVDQTVGLTPPQYRVLKHHEAEIVVLPKTCVSSDSSGMECNVDVKFSDDRSAILLSGSAGDVEAVLQCIRTKYVSAICDDMLKMDLPGVKVRDFAQPECMEYDRLRVLETDKKCAIFVTAEQVDSHRLTRAESEQTLPSASTRRKRAEFEPALPPASFLERLRSASERIALFSFNVPSALVPANGKIKVIKANITSVQVDAVVNVIAGPPPNLKRASRISYAMVQAGGPEIEKEVAAQKWPTQFGTDAIRTSAGKMPAKKIYHAAVDELTPQRGCIQKMENMIKLCLNMAVADNFSTIAFPSVGCGKLGYSPSTVIDCFVKALQATKTDIEITVITTQDDHLEEMKDVLRNTEYGRSLPIGTDDVVVPSDASEEDSSGDESPFLARSLQRTSSDVKIKFDSTASPVKPEIHVVRGDLTSFKADAVVNVIATTKLDLSAASQVSAAILKAAGKPLQEEMMKLKWPQNFGQDVVATKAYGTMMAKKIYHAAVRKYVQDSDYQLMQQTLSLCIEMAIKDGMSSIAFPLLGVNNLQYEASAVADCFIKAKRAAKKPIDVYVVAFAEDDKLATFKAALAKYDKSSTMSSADDRRVSGVEVQSDRHPSRTSVERLVFHIHAMDHETVALVKKSLQAKLEELMETRIVKSDIVARVGGKCERKILDLESDQVRIEIDRRRKSITIKGKKSYLNQVEKSVKVILKEQTTPMKHAKQCRMNGDIAGYLAFLGSDESIRYPKYWQVVSKDGIADTTEHLTQLSDKDPLYQEVLKLFLDTFVDKRVGVGFDAKGLTHKKLVVKTISVVENKFLFQQYYSKKKQLCLQSSVNPIPPFASLKGEREIETRETCKSKGLKRLSRNITPEINECYLLHGTKAGFVERIKSDGFDFRQAGDKLLFGKGVYFAECSTKADQHTDDKQTRPNLGKPLFMCVARVLLGNTFVCQQPRNFCRPPCINTGCHSDKCTAHPIHDSVSGTHGPQGNRLCFREFIVYERIQCYPDFVVEYTRQ